MSWNQTLPGALRVCVLFRVKPGISYSGDLRHVFG